MTKFMDRAGQEWPVEIDLPMRQKLIDAVAIDILDPKRMPELFAGIPRVLDVLVVVCGDEIAKRNLQPIQFFGLLHGRFLEAKQALVEELRLFFQNYGEAANAAVLDLAIEAEKQTIAAQIDAVRNVGGKKIAAHLQKTSARAEREIDKALALLDEPT